LNEYQNTNSDLRIQNYLNFYAKQGLGAPLKIKVPNCIFAESELAMRERYAKEYAVHEQAVKGAKKDIRSAGFKAIFDKNKTREVARAGAKTKAENAAKDKGLDIAKPFELEPLTIPASFKASDKYEKKLLKIEDQKKEKDQNTNTQESKEKDQKKRVVEVPTEYEKGTATFCKALAVCTLEDEVITISNLMCRGKKIDECPTADECYEDQKVVLEKTNLQMETNLKFNDGTQNLEGEQSPSSATQGR